MSSQAKLQISASALVELKAALFSKQREVRSQGKKAGSGNDATVLTTNTVSEKTAAIWRRPPKQKRFGRGGGTAREAARERATQRSAEEEAELERSRKSLEAKAALYDKLCGGEGVRMGGSDSEGEEEEGRYMVDFTRKIVEERKARQQTNSKSEQTDDVAKEGVADEEGEWVEYVDSFGRSRRCPKEELPHMRDQETKRRERSATPDLLSEDMAMERERRRWEEEMEEKLDTPVGPVHYQELRQGEVRTHGVGYYAFSQEEEKRSEQLNLLNKLRDQTVSQREKKAKLQEKRKAQMDARLEKVRQRKQLKQPAVTEEKEEEVAEEEKREEVVVDPLAAMIESELGRAREKAEKGERGSEEQDGGRAKKPYVRPWDKGKVVDPIRKRKKELEDERLSEFAPPSYHFKKSATEPQKLAKMENTDQQGDQSKPPDDQNQPSTTTEDQNVAGSGTASGPPPLPPQNYYQYPPPMFAFPPPFGQPFMPPPPPFGHIPPPPHGQMPQNSRPPPHWYPYFHPPPPPLTMPSSLPPQSQS